MEGNGQKELSEGDLIRQSLSQSNNEVRAKTVFRGVLYWQKWLGP